MTASRDNLFTATFFAMSAFSFTVFLSAFQLFPTAPFRIVALGGTKFQAGLFLGFLTFASALSAPFTGALADRFGRRRTLVASSLVIAGFAAAYLVTESPGSMLALAFAHGVFWSGLLSASGAYATELMPVSRHAEGISYWGMASTLAVAVAPSLGLWLWRGGWVPVCISVGVLNLGMAAIAWALPDDRKHRSPHPPAPRGGRWHDILEWRVTVVAFTMFLYSFGYGGITSFVALYTEANGVAPRGLYFTVFALTIMLTRPFTGRLADRIGHLRVFVPGVVLGTLGYVILAAGGSRPYLVLSALAFGTGFGSAYPIFAAHVLNHVSPARRAAAFGGILAALDTGIGSGSMSLGWVIEHYGFRPAFGLAAVVASLSVPYLLLVEPRMFGARRGAQPTRN